MMIWVVKMRLVLKLICSVRFLESFGCLVISWWLVSGIDVVDVLLVVLMLWVIMVVFGSLSCLVNLLMMCMLVWCGMNVVMLDGLMFVLFSVLCVIFVIFYIV